VNNHLSAHGLLGVYDCFTINHISSYYRLLFCAFSDPENLLAEDARKNPCRQFLQTGEHVHRNSDVVKLMSDISYHRTSAAYTFSLLAILQLNCVTWWTPKGVQWNHWSLLEQYFVWTREWHGDRLLTPLPVCLSPHPHPVPAPLHAVPIPSPLPWVLLLCPSPPRPRMKGIELPRK